MATEIFPPGDYIREELEARGWTQNDLAEILGRPVKLVNDIVNAKRGITRKTAEGLASAFETSPELWLNLESAYKATKANKAVDAVSRRAKIYAKAPVRDMVRRGWIEGTPDLDVLEYRVCTFLGVPDLEAEPQLGMAALTSLRDAGWTPAQIAWGFRAKQLARSLRVARYSEDRLKDALAQMRALLHAPEEIRHIPNILAGAGVRMVVVEPIPNTRIDGAALWLDDESPILALSMRLDRLSTFWHAAIHETDHLLHREGGVVEALFDSPEASGDRHVEDRANSFAANFLIPKAEMDDFIIRKGPAFSLTDIDGFAKRLEVHPSMVVSQLHHMGAWPQTHGNKFTEKARVIITGSTLTDGWGHGTPAIEE